MENTIKLGDKYEILELKQIKRNNIIIYRLTYNDKTNLTLSARVIGLPGDTVEIKNGVIYINNNTFSLPSTAIYHYLIEAEAIDNNLKKDLGILSQNADRTFNAFMTETDSYTKALKYKDKILSIKKTYLESYNQKALLNGKNDLGWNKDNFGPLWVPTTNALIDAEYAKKIINNFEEENAKGTKYKISAPYYFVICDNFHNGEDSRSLGLISQNQIIGTLKKAKN